MNRYTTTDQPPVDQKVWRGTARWIVQSALSLLFLVVALFWPAGTLSWPMAWAVVALQIVAIAFQLMVLLPKSPGLLAERSRLGRGAKAWDLLLSRLVGLFLPLATYLVAGLDRRYGWTSVPPATQIGAFVVAALGWAFTLWAMASNPFFSAVVRIQQERGHRVATGGPYRYVRHPGYLGALVFQLAAPLFLDSWWALLPSGVGISIYAVRTALEDRTLRAELPGYQEYARQVRHRLIPGIW